jgi:hypothetical protein
MHHNMLQAALTKHSLLGTVLEKVARQCFESMAQSEEGTEMLLTHICVLLHCLLPVRLCEHDPKDDPP